MRSPNRSKEYKETKSSDRRMLSPLSYTTSDRQEEKRSSKISQVQTERRKTVRDPHITDQNVDEVSKEHTINSDDRNNMKLEDQAPASSIGKIELVALIAPDSASSKMNDPFSFRIDSSHKTKSRLAERPFTSQPFSKQRTNEFVKE